MDGCGVCMDEWRGREGRREGGRDGVIGEERNVGAAGRM
jgi:hypothetical protein